MMIIKNKLVKYIIYAFICSLLFSGCAINPGNPMTKEIVKGDLIESKQRKKTLNEEVLVNVACQNNERKFNINLQKNIYVAKKKKDIYEECVQKEANYIGKDSDINPIIGGVVANIMLCGWGFPWLLYYKTQEGEEKRGTIETNWQTVDKKSLTKPVANAAVDIRIPEVDYQETFSTNEKGGVHIPLEEIPRFRSLKEGMTVKASGRVDSENYSRTKHFSSQTMTALIEKSSHPPKLAFDVDFQDASGDKVLDAGEKGTIVFNIDNRGRGDAFGVELMLEPKDWVKGVELPKTKSIGRIQESESKQVEVDIQATRSVPTSRISFRAKLKEEFGFDSNPRIVRLQTEKFHKPKLAVTDFGIDDRNQNAQVEPMEVVELTARIKNTGKGKAKDALAEVELGSNIFFATESKEEFPLEDLAPGEEKDISFSFVANKRIEAGEKLPINIHLEEDRAEFQESYPLDITMNAPQRRVEETVIAEKEPSSKAAGQKSSTSLSVEVDKNIPQGSFADSDDVALLIGNRHYDKRGVPDVDYAYRDVNVLKRYLEKTMGFEKVFVVQDATKGTFQTWFGTADNPQGKLHNLVRPQKSRVFVYYVGHGAPGVDTKNNYFVPVDANPDYVESAGYPVSRFYSNLDRLEAQELVVVLDACFSGKTQEGLLFDNVSPAQLVDAGEHDVELSEGVVMSSAQEDELSVWYPEKKHSLFTYYFLKGLGGKADKNGDDRITSGEIINYVSDHVPYKAQTIANRSQNPVLNGDESVVLTRLQ